MKKNVGRKLTLNRETVRRLTAEQLRSVGGATGATRRCPSQLPGCNPCLGTSNWPPPNG